MLGQSPRINYSYQNQAGSFFFSWRYNPHWGLHFTALWWALASSLTRFLDHKQRRTTVGRIPLDEWSVRRRDLYLTTHNTHNRQTSMPRVGFEPTISACERPKTYALDHAATGTGKQAVYVTIFPETLNSIAIDLDFGVTQKDSSSLTCQYKLQRHYLNNPSFFPFRIMTISESYITPTVFHKLNMFCVDFASCPIQTVYTRSIWSTMHDRVIKYVKQNDSKLR